MSTLGSDEAGSGQGGSASIISSCSHLGLGLGIDTMILLVCLAAAATASPQFFNRNQYWNPSGRHIAILSDTRENLGDGRFRYAYRTENGIDVEATGTPGRAGQSNIRGSYSFPFPEGGTGRVTYVADENGYRAESPLIPTPHPLPAHAIEQIRFAESQRRFQG
ncbi:hypothetical protein Pcinc_036281 [Petrolisthes cinctipes]|uniref:Uncharacterized protein n=1 Tax=Petrolisthes cinctipes TaxID=88211 RepID=A0AAE1BVZ1_PETCI|nr:hypothetical protein Pcinc_036281 [Petrolisthes cinctipes]